MPIQLPTEAEPVTVHCGDCLEVLRSLPSSSVDSVITDPPYGIDYQSARRTDKTEWKPKIAGDAAPFVWFLYDAARVMKDDGCLLCFCRWDVQEAFRASIKWAGLEVKSQIVWDREVHGMGDLTGSPAPTHDVIWFATKGKYSFPAARPKSIVRSQRLSGAELAHPNQKPLSLMRRLIRDYVPADGLILDPFGGSGTTGCAAVAERRRAILIEVNDEYAGLCERRINEAMGRGVGSLFKGVV